ncbi:MAG: cardiolipin synthase [Spirochaetales bacterium]|nr:cardiolipin synthase [Spirochaetales bacterium]
MIVLRILYAINTFAVVVICFQILLEDRFSQNALAWIMFLILVPFAGPIAYLIFGVNWRKKKLIRQLPEELFRNELEPVLEAQEKFLAKASVKDEIHNDIYKTIKLIMRSSSAVITANNAIDLYFEGKPFFDALRNDILKARESIHMEFFIWRSDPLGTEFLELLAAKVRENVKVRLIFDGLGSLFTVSRKYRKALKKAGIAYKFFLDPTIPLVKMNINYRNHRKIVVIDGKTAYTGGMNLGTEYMTGGSRFARWRDTQIRLTGQCVRLFQTVFLTDWYNSGNELLTDEILFPSVWRRPAGVPVQFCVSGPDSDWGSIELGFFHIIANANHEICIQSPYFIPGEPVQQALETAALSGISVHLMMTGRPDKLIPFFAAFTYFKRLLEAGVRIYLYTAGFLHSKVVIADANILSVGSCNFDLRSFRLDYEGNVFVYDRKTAEKMRDQFFKDMDRCSPFTFDDLKRFSFPRRLVNSVCRLFSPLM